MTAPLNTRRPVRDSEIVRLRLPRPTERFADCAPTQSEPIASCPRTPARDVPTLAWYRWVLGHHVSFCVWRLMLETFATADGDSEVESALAALYDSYSALLLYAGSCSPEIYETVLRARMRAVNPAMSGTWARDYREVLVCLGRLPLAPDSPLKAALRFNRLVHMSVGARLVPGGRSLLRDAGRDAHQEPTPAEIDTVDEFFRTDRAPVCVHEFLDQLRVRVRAVLADLAANPIELRYDRPVVNEFQDELGPRIRAAARLAVTILGKGAIDLD